MLLGQTQSCKLEEVAQSIQIGKISLQCFHITIELLCSRHNDLLATIKPRLGKDGIFVLETSVGPVTIR